MATNPRTPFAKGVDLTLKQRAFVTILVRQGCNPTQAARQAGYAEPKVASFDLLRTAHIQEAIRQERARYVSGDLANIATGTLKAIMEDDTAPASARVSAARTALELAGELGKGRGEAVDDRPFSEMSVEELGQLLARWRGERAELVIPIKAEPSDCPDSVEGVPLLQ